MTLEVKYPTTSKNSNQWIIMTGNTTPYDDDSSYLYNNDQENRNDRSNKKWKWNKLWQSIKNYLFGQYECQI